MTIIFDFQLIICLEIYMGVVGTEKFPSPSLISLFVSAKFSIYFFYGNRDCDSEIVKNQVFFFK